MSIALGIILTVITFAFIAFPLLRPANRFAGTAADSRKEEQQAKRLAARNLLKELDFDRQSGVLSDADYNELKAKYLGNVLPEHQPPAAGIEDEIERRIQARRSLKGESSGSDNIEKEINSRRVKKFCTQCGTKIMENDKFCTGCGKKLTGGKAQ